MTRRVDTPPGEYLILTHKVYTSLGKYMYFIFTHVIEYTENYPYSTKFLVNDINLNIIKTTLNPPLTICVPYLSYLCSFIVTSKVDVDHETEQSNVTASLYQPGQMVTR